jgi:hypothetical protein
MRYRKKYNKNQLMTITTTPRNIAKKGVKIMQHKLWV